MKKFLFFFIPLLIFLSSFTVNSLYSTPVGNCTITGEVIVETNQMQVYVIPDTIKMLELYSYNGANASIFSNNQVDTVIVSTGNSLGKFTIYNLDSNGNNLCSLNVSIDAALPVELISFASAVSDNEVTLTWSTSMEENNKGFEIFRSAYSEDVWNGIGFVKGAGNSSAAKNYAFEDNNLNTGIYKYRLKQIDYNGNFKFYDLQNEVEIGIPDKYSLYQNYPNPFNPVTKISYTLPVSQLTVVKIYNVSGEEVQTLVNEVKESGYHSVYFDAHSFSSGVYFYKIEAGDFVMVRKMMLLK